MITNERGLRTSLVRMAVFASLLNIAVGLMIFDYLTVGFQIGWYWYVLGVITLLYSAEREFDAVVELFKDIMESNSGLRKLLLKFIDDNAGLKISKEEMEDINGQGKTFEGEGRTGKEVY